jgi:hypothetical protein
MSGRRFVDPIAFAIAFGAITTGYRMAAHRGLDQRRDDLCAGALRKCVVT